MDACSPSQPALAPSFAYLTGIGDCSARFVLVWPIPDGNPSSVSAIFVRRSRIGHRPIAVNPGDLGRDFGNACRELRCNGLKVKKKMRRFEVKTGLL